MERVRVVAWVGIAILLLTACAEDLASEPGATTIPRLSTMTNSVRTTTQPASPVPAEPPLTQRVDKTIFVGALQIDVAAAGIDRKTGEITIEGMLTNHNPLDENPGQILARTTTWVEFPDLRLELSTFPVPPTPVGAASPVQWTVWANTNLNVDLTAGRMVFGASNENRSVLPFGPGEVETIVPVMGLIDGLVVENSAVRVTIARSMIRSTYSGETAGHRRLDLLIEAAGLADEHGGYRLNSDQFALVLPDGTTRVGQAPEDGYPLLSVLNAGTTSSGWVSFDLTEEDHGTGALVVSTPDIVGVQDGSITLDLP